MRSRGATASCSQAPQRLYGRRRLTRKKPAKRPEQPQARHGAAVRHSEHSHSLRSVSDGLSSSLRQDVLSTTASTFYDTMLLPFVTHIIAMILSSASSTSLSCPHVHCHPPCLSLYVSPLYLMTLFRFIAFYCISYCTYIVHSDTARLVFVALMMTCNAPGCCSRFPV